MQKTLGQRMVLKTGNDSVVAPGRAETMNRHTHTSSSQSPLDVTDMPVIVDNKLSGNKEK